MLSGIDLISVQMIVFTSLLNITVIGSDIHKHLGTQCKTLIIVVYTHIYGCTHTYTGI